jgi:hypothetical protein
MTKNISKASSAGVGARAYSAQGPSWFTIVEESFELLRVVVESYRSRRQGGIAEVGHGRQQDISRVLRFAAKPLNPASQVGLSQLNLNAVMTL